MPQCQQCGRENDSTRQYCVECGVSLGNKLPEAATAKKVPTRTGLGHRSRISDYAETKPADAGKRRSVPPTEVRRYCPKHGLPTDPTTGKCSQCPSDAPDRKTNPVIPGVLLGRIVELYGKGFDGKGIDLDRSETIIGRSGHCQFPDDPYMENEHVKITRTYDEYGGSVYTIEDLDTHHGTFLRLDPEDQWELEDGAEFIVGQQRLRFYKAAPGAGLPGVRWRVGVLDQDYNVTESFKVLIDGTQIGRRNCDISFSDDDLVSNNHASIAKVGGKFFLRDQGSTNFTFVRVIGSETLNDRDYVMIGLRRFRFEILEQSDSSKQQR